jgi:hypothetical protein
MAGFPPDVHRIGGEHSVEVHRAAAREFYAPLLPLILELHRRGLSLRKIARELDARGVKTRMQYPGQRWSAQQVKRVLARALAEPAKVSYCDSTPDVTVAARSNGGGDQQTALSNVADLLDCCRYLGYTLTVEDGELVVSYKGIRPSRELWASIEASDSELIALLTQPRKT